MVTVHWLLTLFVWAEDAGAAPPPFLTYLLPATGLILIIFCLVARKSEFLSQPQKVEVGAFHVQIAIFSVIFLVGTGMMVGSYFRYVVDRDRDWNTLTQKERHAEERADAAERVTLRLVLAYPNQLLPRDLVPLASRPGDPVRNLTCRYKKVSSSAHYEEAQVIMGQQDTVEVVISDLSHGDVIQDVLIEPANPEKVSNQVLAQHAVFPLTPRYDLKLEEFPGGH
jgi:hypothetical protein